MGLLSEGEVMFRPRQGILEVKGKSKCSYMLSDIHFHHELSTCLKISSSTTERHLLSLVVQLLQATGNREIGK